ncbi:DUF2256 domain-containing protein [Cypionkella sp.]|uniref:DUF2256 domain-containing protein n=1 Tax=Cypionkella sp. TaxID=2811411 RepID=UPI002721D585|nr:DUF2256 domain-containing protein [Cypionkella sp.]MDO8983848.1 DUF2256 domain-containing protein [Cypionkella sp.]MDP2051594.1 DUF2256 domain-containing protein [Cypionkella sp.]
MPNLRKQADLPVKTCAAWRQERLRRKAWEKMWDQVNCCSDRCRNTKVKPRP